MWIAVVYALKNAKQTSVASKTVIAQQTIASSDSAEHQKILFDALPGPKEFHVIKGAPHTFLDQEHLKEIEALFLKWIDSWQSE